MAEQEIVVGLILERIKLTGPWSDHAWMPCQILEGLPDAPAWTPLLETPERSRYYAGAYPIRLHSADTAYHRDNLTSGAPKLWVAMRPLGPQPPVEIAAITANPTEGESFTETGTTLVETIDMPPGIAAEIAAFIEAHHVERVFEKRKRDRSQPNMMAKRGPREGST